MDIIEKCASTHTKVEELLKEVVVYKDDAKTLFLYCMKWPNVTQGIKDEMESIESQIANASKAYDPALEKDDKT